MIEIFNKEYAMDFKYTSLQPIDLCNSNKKIIGKFYVKVSSEGIFLQGKNKCHLLSDKRPINTDYDDSGKIYCNVFVIKTHQEGIGESAFIVFNDSDDFNDFTSACYDIEELFVDTEIPVDASTEIQNITEEENKVEEVKTLKENLCESDSQQIISDTLALENTYFLNIIFANLLILNEKLSFSENKNSFIEFADYLSKTMPHLFLIQHYLPNIILKLDKNIYPIDESEYQKNREEWLKTASMMDNIIVRLENIEGLLFDSCEDYKYAFPANFALNNLCLQALYREKINVNCTIKENIDFDKVMKKCKQEWEKIKFVLPSVVNNVMNTINFIRSEYYFNLYKRINKDDENKLNETIFVHQSNLSEFINMLASDSKNESITNGALAENILNLVKESELFINNLTYSFNKY